MDKKLTKEEVRTPDQMTQGLGRFAEWVSKNIVVVVGALVGLLVLGGVISVVDYFSTQKESDLQGKMSRVEHQYTEKKTKFKEAEQSDSAKALASAKAASKNAAKADAKKDEKTPPAVKASGNLEKDYGTEVAGFEELVAKNASSKAGQMSAIYLAEIYSEYKQPDKALEALNKVAPKNELSDVVSALAVNLKAGLLADKGDCTQAVDIWQKIINQKKIDYMHDEAKLRSAVCFEKMNDTAKAEKYYLELSKNTASKDEPDDKAATEDAKKYLRLLKIRSNGGTLSHE